MPPDEPGFLDELKRRHVWRVAAAYAIAGWLIVQIATQVFPFFNIPNWGVRLVVILIAIGFPVAVAFAWIYELTPEGIRRTEPADSPDARPATANHQIGRKLNALIVAVLVLAVTLLGWRLIAVRRAPAPAVAKAAATSATPAKVASKPAPAIAPTPAQAVPAKSVAVLPFVNESGEKSQQYFSDGLSEDLITALSQFAGLKVISRDSAFQFRNSKDTSAEIGKLLGVAHLLEGSVQRAGDEVRITATLVNAANGSVVWSERYDKPYKDLFALQDAITRAVSGALKAKLLLAPGAVIQSDRPPSGNLAAYAAFQHGAAYATIGSEAGTRQAIAAYTEATRLDPRYAAAYANLAFNWAALAVFYGGANTPNAIAHARAASAASLKLNPNLAMAHVARARLLMDVDMDWRAAEAEALRALQLAPNDPLARGFLAATNATLGQNQRAVELQQRSVDANPRSAAAHYTLSTYLTALDRLDGARQAAETAIRLQPQGAINYEQLTIIDILRGNARGAVTTARGTPPGGWREVSLALALQPGSDRAVADAALQKLIKGQAGNDAYQVAEVYALRHDPDAMFKWLDRAWANRDPGISTLLYDPLILRYRHDPRFAAFCKKVGLPDTTDAVAMQ